MKNLIIVLCLALALPMVGCSLMKQSNRARIAIENQNYSVEKVVVKVENGHKRAVVHMRQEVSKEEKAEIRELVLTEIPDAEKITFKRSGGTHKAKPVKKAKPAS